MLNAYSLCLKLIYDDFSEVLLKLEIIIISMSYFDGFARTKLELSAKYTTSTSGIWDEIANQT